MINQKFTVLDSQKKYESETVDEKLTLGLVRKMGKYNRKNLVFLRSGSV